jgi:hypothetical protein
MKKSPQILIISLFVILATVQAGKKFVLDEIDFPIVSLATSDTGIPVYYRGEDAFRHLGIYHPTLYINSLALFIKLFGYNENVIRTFGMLCVLITATIFIYIYRHIYQQKNETFEFIFLGLFLLNPYTISNSGLPDIDSTVMPVTISLFFLYIIKCFKQQKNDLEENEFHLSKSKIIFNVSVLSFLFSLCLWTKLTTPLAIPIFSIPLLLALGKNIKFSILIPSLVASIGSFVFLSTYWIYCKALDLPYVYTFRFLVDSFTKGTSGSSVIDKIISNISYLHQFVYWITIPTTFLIIFSICYITIKKREGDWATVVLGLFGIVISIFYLCLIQPFGGFFKYPYPVFPFVLMPAAVLSSEFFNIENIKDKKILIMTSLTVIFYSFFFKDTDLLENKIFRYTILLVIGSILLGLTMVKLNNKKATLIAISTLLFISISCSLGVSRSQALSKYPTRYHYGQAGMENAINYLKGRVAKNEIIWSMKDVGYYVNNKYIENYSYFFDEQKQKELISMTNEGKVRYYVTTVGIGEDRIDVYPEIKSILDSNCQKYSPKVFGNFVIYNCGK